MPYERLEAWQACYALALAVYRVTKRFPREELYGLTAQARRAAFSGPANVAEGSAKRGSREFARYLDIANGSLAELSCTLRLSRDLGHLSADEWSEVEGLRETAGRLTWGLYASMRRADRPTA
ncbi:MAG: four helix bundle protein [Gemmatimonadales bacterium]